MQDDRNDYPELFSGGHSVEERQAKASDGQAKRIVEAGGQYYDASQAAPPVKLYVAARIAAALERIADVLERRPL